jgi:hypothetical protein
MTSNRRKRANSSATMHAKRSRPGSMHHIVSGQIDAMVQVVDDDEDEQQQQQQQQHFELVASSSASEALRRQLGKTFNIAQNVCMAST